MTEAEAHAIMKAQGWSYQKRIRHKRRIPYVYAKRRQGKNFLERYICPLSKLEGLTEQELLTKLASKPTSKL